MECNCYNCERSAARAAAVARGAARADTGHKMILGMDLGTPSGDVTEAIINGVATTDDWEIALWFEWQEWRRTQARDAAGVVVTNAPGAAP